MLTKTSLLACAAVAGFGSVAAWPIKTIDPSDDGANCDTTKEQYLQVEAYDFHDHPKITMRWRQISGECGAPVSNPMEWEESYDVGNGDAPPDEGRVQLNIFVCAPFGHYEIDLDVDSYSDEGSTLQQRTAWEIENGPDEYHIWDTVNTYLADDEDYSPTVPGKYTWPLPGEIGYYSVLYAGPLPPIQCDSSTPAGTTYEGCYEDSKGDRLFDSEAYVLAEMGRDGMTLQACSDHCSEYKYFGVEFGRECFCGTETEFNSAVSSDQCGLTYESLCTGDSTAACGGRNAISVYKRGEVDPPAPTPAPITPTPPSPTPPPTDPPTPTSGSTYSSVGCFRDSKSNRIMSDKQTPGRMSAEVCSGLCGNGSNTHFGTQYGAECWCATDPDLVANEPELEAGQCDYDCAGNAGEKCGGYNAISAYVIGEDDGGYIGCYADRKGDRTMGDRLVDSEMTNEVCQAHCEALQTAYYGTQYGRECWCGDNYDKNGEYKDGCTYPCDGDATQMCGGYNALSVYNVN